jgi:peptidoglycan/LPS O-acetylase OafA/YrhL
MSSLALLAVLSLVFIRASIEVGEERPWILLYLFSVPPATAGVLVWSLNRLRWPLRAGLGLAVLAIVAVLLVQSALLADRIYEDPTAFRPVLPAILCAESLYLDVFHADPERRTRHKEKTDRWRGIWAPRP